MSDPIADMVIRLKNGTMAHKSAVLVPYSNLKFAIASVLEKQGFVGSVSRKGKRGRKFIEIELRYNGRSPRIAGVRRVSKPSRRAYVAVRDIRPVKRGFGRLILSTPKGILTGEEARKIKAGGEALFQIW